MTAARLARAHLVGRAAGAGDPAPAVGVACLEQHGSDAEQALDEHLAVALRYVPATP